MKRKLLVFIMLGFVLKTFAQHSITGKVSDAETGEVIPGVTVLIKGSTNGTITDLDGNYTINASPTDTLQFSYVGYITENSVVGSQETVDVNIVPDLINLKELVVVGYGTVKKEHVTGSVALVTSDDFDDRPNNQVGSLLQGKATGVRVLTNSGKPSEGFNIRVRGTNSINASSEPLYVVDGIPTTDTRNINPSDIESISVLKDASSAAIYGAQGANGVVIISTKRGTTNKPRLTFDTYIGSATAGKTLKVLNSEQYRDLMTEMGQTTDWEQYTENTDWQDLVLQTGISKNYQLAFSGISNGTSYYVSGGFMDQNGIIRTSEMQRINFKVNLDQEINNWLKCGAHIAYTNYNDVDVNDNSDVGGGGVLTGALFTPPNIGVFNDDGTYTSNPFQDWENPLASTDAPEKNYNQRGILGNVYAEIKFMDGLKFKSNVGLDEQHGVYDYFLSPYLTSYGISNGGIAENNIYKTTYYTWDNTLHYTKNIGAQHIKLLAGAIIQKWKYENSYIKTSNFSSDAITTTNAGSTINSASNDKSEKTNASFIGRVDYDYDNKYLLTANFRADGSSNFGSDNRWGYFPSVSAGWRISRESFLQSVDFLSDLKLRIGWGITGNDQIGTYAYYGTTSSGANYPIGGSLQPGTYPKTLQNNALKWEESNQTNIGLDLGLYEYRIQFTVDAYVKNTSDLLISAPLPLTTGYSSATQNIGNLQNKGLEFGLNTINIDGKIRWSTDFNISFNTNEVTELYEDILDGSINDRTEACLVREGEPLGALYGYRWGGVDPESGDGYYITANGESTFSPDADEDRTIIGYGDPDFFYGIGNTVTYKNLSLNIFLEGSYGNELLNATRIEGEAMSTASNQLASVKDRWKESGDVTDIPRASWASTNNSLVSDRFIEDGSYLRIKTVSLYYTLPKNLLSKIKVESAKIYATGENLFTFTKYSGYDPEVNTFEDSNIARGVDYGTCPQPRNIIIGINLTL